MTKLKYAGLCAAGLAMNLVCLPIDWLFCYIFDLFYTVRSAYLLLLAQYFVSARDFCTSPL